jgi:hypothetical protein
VVAFTSPPPHTAWRRPSNAASSDMTIESKPFSTASVKLCRLEISAARLLYPGEFN